MNPDRYGIQSPDELLSNVQIIKLMSGEVLISYTTLRENGVIAFTPFEIVDDDSGIMFKPFMPFFKEKMFFFPYDHTVTVKKEIHSFIVDRFKQMSETLYKTDIEDLIIACSKSQSASDITSVSKENVTIH